MLRRHQISDNRSAAHVRSSCLDRSSLGRFYATSKKNSIHVFSSHLQCFDAISNESTEISAAVRESNPVSAELRRQSYPLGHRLCSSAPLTSKACPQLTHDAQLHPRIRSATAHAISAAVVVAIVVVSCEGDADVRLEDVARGSVDHLVPLR